MNALEVIAGYTTSATEAALTAAGSDQFKLRSTGSHVARILTMWGSDGLIKVLHPQFGVYGLTANFPGSSLQKMFDESNPISIADGETLSPRGNKTIDSLFWAALIYYEQSEAIERARNYITLAEYERRRVRPFNLQVNSLVGSATTYGTRQALRSGANRFTYQNREYAWLGALPSTTYVPVLRLYGEDTKGIACGMPLNNALGYSSGIDQFFFLELARKTGLPVIPVFYSTNDGNTFVDIFGTAETVNVTLQFAEVL